MTMPLPPLLAERLRRRNILRNEENASNGSDTNQNQATSNYDGEVHHTVQLNHGENSQTTVAINNLETQDQEEVFAENYSDDDDADEDNVVNDTHFDEIDLSDDHVREYLKDDEEIIHETSLNDENPSEEAVETVLGCPNKYNLYHRCSRYCQERYCNPRLEPKRSQLKLLSVLLRHYPITPDWKPIYDPGVETFYFWNTITDQVTWLPFGHPGANVTVPVDIVRQMMVGQEKSLERFNVEK